MQFKYIVFVLMLCTCAAPVPRKDERRVPRGWTLDTSKQELSAVGVREQKAFGEGKVVQADDYSANSLTDGTHLIPAEGKAQLKHLIENHNKLLCFNKALEATVLAAEDQRCFAYLRNIRLLEVWVTTAVGAMRKDGRWPQFELELGSKDVEQFPPATALDGGTVVFRKHFPVKEDKDGYGYNMQEVIGEITLRLYHGKDRNTNEYVDFKESFGGNFCTDHKWWGGCKRRETLQEHVLIETNRLHIDHVSIYLRFYDDEHGYKVFDSNSSAQAPLVILDNTVPSYTVAGFQNNPHWLLHFYASTCESWQGGDHDGTDFGKYIWDNHIKKANNTAIDVYNSPLRCAGTYAAPVYLEPVVPELDSVDDESIKEWLADNHNKFKPRHSNEQECQTSTPEGLRKETLEQDVCPLKKEQLVDVPSDLDSWSAERLKNAVTYENGEINKVKIGNVELINKWETLTGSGCFYEKPLIGALKIKITGKLLVNVSGKLMTREEANTDIFNGRGLGTPPDGNILYVNLGLNQQSYPLVDSPFAEKGHVIDQDYLKNFSVRDIKYLHLEKTASEKFFSYQTIRDITHSKYWFWSSDRRISHASIPVEQGVMALSSVALIFNDRTIYERGSDLVEEDTAAKITDMLSVLSSSNNIWRDNLVHSNEEWRQWRYEPDHCVEEESSE